MRNRFDRPCSNFIICAPRSGTTWLNCALNAHPEVYATELRAFGGHVDLVHEQGGARPRLRVTLDRYIDALLGPHHWGPLGPTRDAVADDLLGTLYATLQEHALRRSGKRVFVDKLTPYLGTADKAVGAVARICPGARIVLLLRDGRDVAVSGVMHWLTKELVGEQASDQLKQRRAFFLDLAGPPPERFFSDTELEQWATIWRQPIEAIDAHRSTVKCLVVRYEDMSRDFGTELRRICTFLEVDASPARLDPCLAASAFEVMSGGRRRGEDAPGQHVRKGVVGDWRRYFTAADAAQFDRIAGQHLVEQGYEPDHEWTTRVPERLCLGERDRVQSA